MEGNATILAIESLNYRISNEVAAVISCDNAQDISILDEIFHEGKTFKVTSIADRAFAETSITSVHMGDNITHIGKECFKSCEHLRTVWLSKTIYSFGDHAFEKCTNLKEVIFPEDFLGITDTNGFYGIEKGHYWLGRDCFEDCLNLEQIILPKGITSLPLGCFELCRSLKTINLPNTIQKIDNKCFSYCQSLESVDIPYKVKDLMFNAFEGCKSLKQIKLPEQLQTIRSCCFYNCESLESIELPKNLRHIGDCAFWGCKSLRSINIPANLDGQTSLSFRGCISLIHITFHSEDYKIEDIVIADCKFLDEETKAHVVITEAGLRLAKERKFSTKAKKWSKSAALFPFKLLCGIIGCIIFIVLAALGLIIIGGLYNIAMVAFSYILLIILPVIVIGGIIYAIINIFTDK